MTYEFVEVLAIGSPPGPALIMQVVYFAIGLALVSVSLVLSAMLPSLRTAAGGNVGSRPPV
jgi:hypothetical protein